MNARSCNRIPLAVLTDYAAGDLSEAEATAIEEHLFACAECAAYAAEFDAVLRGIRAAVGSAEVAGFVTDDVLNRLAREGVRVRTFVLAPGARVPCAVWEDDDLMALRLRGAFGDARELTISQRVAGAEVMRATYDVAPDLAEVIHVAPAAWIRPLPEVEIEIILTGRTDAGERPIASYTLLHGGTLHRR